MHKCTDAGMCIRAFVHSCITVFPPSPRKSSEEVLEAFEVQRPAWRKLVEDRTERRTQFFCPRKEQIERSLRILQLFHVRQETAGLHGKREPSRGGGTPSPEHVSARKAVEGVVDLDRIEVRRVMAEPPRGGEPGRIEVAAPVTVLPAGTADENARVLSLLCCQFQTSTDKLFVRVRVSADFPLSVET